MHQAGFEGLCALKEELMPGRAGAVLTSASRVAKSGAFMLRIVMLAAVVMT